MDTITAALVVTTLAFLPIPETRLFGVLGAFTLCALYPLQFALFAAALVALYFIVKHHRRKRHASMQRPAISDRHDGT